MAGARETIFLNAAIIALPQFSLTPPPSSLWPFYHSLRANLRHVGLPRLHVQLDLLHGDFCALPLVLDTR